MASLFRAKPLSRFAKGEMARPPFQRTPAALYSVILSLVCLGVTAFMFYAAERVSPIPCRAHFNDSGEFVCELNEPVSNASAFSGFEIYFVEWNSGFGERRSLRFLRLAGKKVIFSVVDSTETENRRVMNGVLLFRKPSP